MRNRAGAGVVAILLIGLVGCGGLRYSQTAPEAKDFHPQRIAVLPADTTAFPEAKAVIDRLFAEVLAERQWFTRVSGGEEIGRRMESDRELQQAVAEYLAKERTVSYSDPHLSKRIGALTGSDALLIVRVDYWNYTTENDSKVGKVGISITMIEAATGKAIWSARHNRASDYVLLRPALADVARSLIREMLGHMPH
jgi:hypothetical protein